MEPYSVVVAESKPKTKIVAPTGLSLVLCHLSIFHLDQIRTLKPQIAFEFNALNERKDITYYIVIPNYPEIPVATNGGPNPECGREVQGLERFRYVRACLPASLKAILVAFIRAGLYENRYF